MLFIQEQACGLPTAMCCLTLTIGLTTSVCIRNSKISQLQRSFRRQLTCEMKAVHSISLYTNRFQNFQYRPQTALTPITTFLHVHCVKFRQMHEDQPPQCTYILFVNLHRRTHVIENLMNIHISSAPHSPRRQKLNLRMKSLSLDSPESTEHAQRRKHHGAAATSDPHSNQSSSSRIQCRQNARNNIFQMLCFRFVLLFFIFRSLE